jgi:hypothetical protein
MIEEDFDMIKTMVEDITAIKGIQLSIQPSKYGMNAAPIGAALFYIDSYLKNAGVSTNQES